MAAPVIVRTLRREYRIRASDAVPPGAFAFMQIEPEIVGATLLPVDLPVTERHGFCELCLPGGETVAGTASTLLGALHDLIWTDVLDTEPGAPLIHGATVLGPWGRVLLVGSKTSGKTTLALHLIAAGHRVEGDEHVVIRAAAVIARPRTLRVKPGSLAFVPSLAGRIRACPAIAAWDGTPIHAVPPSIGGAPWTIAEGKLDHLVFVEPNHGGRSGLRPVRKETVLPRLLRESVLPATGVAAAFARLRHLALTTPAFRLSLGDPEGAERSLLRLA